MAMLVQPAPSIQNGAMVIAPVLATLADRRARGIASTAGSSAHHVLFVWYFLRLW